MPAVLRFRVEKLIRDRMPEFMRERGVCVSARQLDDAEFLQCLRRKLQEEAAEVVSARSREDLVEELADLAEVMLALCEASGIAPAELETVRRRKLASRGGFAARVYSHMVEVDAGSAAAEYYLSRPQQYPPLGE